MGISVDSTCRICLENGSKIKIFLKSKETRSGSKVACHKMMTALFSFSVYPGDGLPTKLCRTCHTELTAAYQLKLLAEKSFQKLSKHFKTDTGDSDIELSRLKMEKETEIDESPDTRVDRLSLKLEPTEVEDSGLEGLKLEGLQADDDDFIIIQVTEEQSSREEVIDKENDENIPAKKARGRRKKLRPTSGVCDLCGAQAADLAKHRAAHTKPSLRLACDQCPKVFRSYTARIRHRNVHHLGQLYYCDLCKKNYKNGYEHRRLVHSAKPRSFPCIMCGKNYLTQAKLRHHITVHTQERAFPCSTCGKGFRSRADSEYHRRNVHEKEKKFMCAFCPKGFFFSQNLKVHLRSHTKEKLFTCGVCGKAFSTKSQQSVHELRHTGVKEVTCQLCCKEFINNGALKNHIVTHTRERAHTCQFCGIKFGRADHRNRHEKTAHGYPIVLVDS